MTTRSASELVLVDSSGWVEYFGEGPKAETFAPYLENEPLLVPTVVLYEVYKKLRQAESTTAADRFVSQALRQRVVPLDEPVALAAAKVSLEHHLPMADAIIYATALLFRAELVTSDPDFKDLPGVKLV